LGHVPRARGVPRPWASMFDPAGVTESGPGRTGSRPMRFRPQGTRIMATRAWPRHPALGGRRLSCELNRIDRSAATPWLRSGFFGSRIQGLTPPGYWSDATSVAPKDADGFNAKTRRVVGGAWRPLRLCGFALRTCFGIRPLLNAVGVPENGPGRTGSRPTRFRPRSGCFAVGVSERVSPRFGGFGELFYIVTRS
jgi:hypothetical protein